MKPTPELQVERRLDAAADAVVVTIRGVLGETAACYAFLEEMRRDVPTFPSKIVVNLSGVQRMTSPGVGVLAACYTSAKNADKRLVLAAVPKVALRVLEVAGLAKVIPVHATEAEALRA